MDKNFTIVDTRSRVDYRAGYIAGAVNIPVADTFSPVKPNGQVGNLQHIQNLFSTAGINKNDTVVIYDGTSPVTTE